MGRRIVTVFGGSGFLGRHIVQRLAADGAIVRVAVRDVEAAAYLKPLGDPGQIVPVYTDITDPALIAAVVKGADAAINLVGILFEKRRRTFQRLHVEGAANVAAAAREAGVERLIHLSAIGADPTSRSVYARTKAEGENAVKQAFPGATILRPSVVFGPEDDFFNRFAALARLMPVLPVFGCPMPPKIDLARGLDLYGDGGTKFQPVYVGDVAQAVVNALADTGTRNKLFELGGPNVYSFKDMMELVLEHTARRRVLLPIPFWLADFYAMFLERLPVPPLTRDQVTLLQWDNVVWERALDLADLGIEATSVKTVLPTYLHRYRPQKFQAMRAA